MHESKQRKLRVVTTRTRSNAKGKEKAQECMVTKTQTSSTGRRSFGGGGGGGGGGGKDASGRWTRQDMIRQCMTGAEVNRERRQAETYRRPAETVVWGCVQ